MNELKKEFENLNLASNVLFPDPAQLPNMNGKQSIDRAFAQGLLNYKRRQFYEASQQFQRALKGRHCGSFVPHFIRGLCSFSLGHYQLALEDFTVCIQASVSQSRTKYEEGLAFYNRSLVHIKLIKIDKAMNDVNTAIELFPTEPLFHTCRALLCRRLGRFEDAQRDYQTLRRLQAKAEKATMICNEDDEGEKSGLRRQETIIISSRLKKMSSSFSFNSKSFTNSATSTDLKTKLYGVLHAALTCCPAKRTKHQIDLLVEESRMMAAFSHFDAKQLSTLWNFLEYKNYPSNTRIFEEGDKAHDYFLVWSGSVSARINKRIGGLHYTTNIASALAMEHELKVNIMTAGETLGEAILSEDGIRKASCVTEEPSEIIVLNRKHFDSTFHLFLDKIMKEKIEFLSGFDFLSDWDNKELNSLAQICRQKTYHSGDIIIKQNTSADSIYFIKTGMVSLIRTLAICEVTFSTLGTGEVFGETSLIRGDDLSTFSYSAVCDTMTILYRLDKMQITKNQWGTLAKDSKLTSKTASYPDDATLIKSYLDEQKFNRKRDTFIKSLRKNK